jgi:hypothetical protein
LGTPDFTAMSAPRHQVELHDLMIPEVEVEVEVEVAVDDSTTGAAGGDIFNSLTLRARRRADF